MYGKEHWRFSSMLVGDMDVTRDHDWQTVDRQLDAEGAPQ